MMDSFSDVVYLLRMPAFLKDQGSKLSSRSSDKVIDPELDLCYNHKRIKLLAVLKNVNLRSRVYSQPPKWELQSRMTNNPKPGIVMEGSQ